MTDMHVTYDIRCTTQLLPNRQVNRVKERLRNSFQLDDEEIKDFFNGVVRFERYGVDAFTAEHYRKLFHAIGLVAEIAESLSVKDGAKEANHAAEASSIPSLCPKCFTKKEIEGQDQCHHCGIYFKKYEARQLTNSEEVDKPVSELDEDDIREMKFAAKFFGLSAIVFAVAFVVDDYLSDVLLIGRAVGIDIGYLPYIVATGLLSIGSVILMRLRGYHGAMGLLALTGAPGLGLLLLLPNKRSDTERRLLDTNNLLGVVLIIAGLLWFSDKAGGQNEMIEVLALAEPVHAGRNEYPASEIDDLPSILESEFNEVVDLLNRGFAVMNKGALRPDDMEVLGEMMFYEASRFLVWLQYQRYLNIREFDEVPEVIDKEAFNHFALMLKNQIKDGVISVNRGRLTEVYLRWFAFSVNEDLAARRSLLSSPLIELWQKISKLRNLSGVHDGERNRAIEEAIAQLDENEVPGARLQSSEDRITLHFLPGTPFYNEPPLTLAYSARPYYRYKKKEYYHELIQINPEFPNKNLINNFDVYYGVMLE